MRRPLAVVALALGVAAALPATPASACDVSQSPLCLVPVCRTVDHWHETLTTILTDPVPKPVC